MRCPGFRSGVAAGVVLGALFGGSTCNLLSAERTRTEPANGIAAPDTREAFAGRVFALTDLVLERHIDPPTRQEMILGGMKAAVVASKKGPNADLSRRVSDVRTVDELSALLEEVWPPSNQTAANPSPGTPVSGSAAKTGPTEQFKNAFLAGLFNTIAGHPHLVSAKEARAESQIQANRYVGLGIALGWDDKKPFPDIKKTISGGSAELGGMQVGDLIEAIDGAPIVRSGTGLRDVVERLRGAEGTKVTLRLGRSDSKEVRTITFVRLPVMFRAVHEVKPNAQNGDAPRIGVLRIDSVTASTPQELRAWEVKLQSAGAQAIILDLRNVHDIGPESHHAAILLADSLLDGKPIGKLRTREREQEFTADRETLFRDLPVGVLVNENTSGSAEWVAAALQDADPPKQKHKRRAIIIGKPTRGGNLITSAVPLPGNDGYLILATGSWQRPNVSGANAQHTNRSPDEGDAPTGSWHVVPDELVDDNPARRTNLLASLPELLVEAIADLARAHDARMPAKKQSSPKAAQKPESEGADALVDVAVEILSRHLTATGQPAK